MENPERGTGGSWEPGEGSEWEPGTGSGAGWEPGRDKEPGWEHGADGDAGGDWEPEPEEGLGWEPDLGKELGWEPGWGRGVGRNQGGAARGKGGLDGRDSRYGRELSPAENQAIETVLHGARALLLADLTAVGIAAAGIVSMLEDAVSERRWWLRQWPEGGPHIPGLLAQDIQDALLETRGRWPLCPLCAEPHALAVEPELGPDPHWVCEARGEAVAAVGSLRLLPPHAPPEPPDSLGG
jgi:hypothetical protein